jgi:transketolase
VYAGWDAKHKGVANESLWNDKFAAYQVAFPELAAEYERRVLKGDLPADFEAKAQAFIQESQDKAVLRVVKRLKIQLVSLVLCCLNYLAVALT